MPLLHARSFGDDFREFWAGMDQTNMHDNEPSMLLRKKPGFLCLLSSMLFSTLTAAPKMRVRVVLEEENIPDTGEMHFAAMVSANLTGFPRQPSIYTLAAYIFAQSQFAREEEFAYAPDFISTTFRIALGMGLHRHFPDAGFTPAEMETRRRLWWYILHLDVMSSSSSGLSPLFIDERMANTNHISQYDCVGSASKDEVASRRYEITKEIRVILKCHFEDHFSSPDHVNEVAERLDAVAEGVNSTIETLLKVRSSRPRITERSHRSRAGQSPAAQMFERVWSLRPDPDDQEVINFSAWAALLLHLMVHKAYCVLYRPLFKDQSISSHETIRSNDDASLSRGLIDAIFEFYQVDEGIVSRSEPPRRHLSPSGKDAWTMLVRTRRKALEQIGVDHHVLYPSPFISSSSCICGVRVAAEKPGEPSTQQHWSGGPSAAGQQEVAMEPLVVNEEQPEFLSGSLGQMDIDWVAWDNAVGPSIGMML
ncbi:hypothetical protein LTR72_000877 [Exophiala xenobiotica]|nr:hypothetical protein LTR72_000877 [Exophiala xenobiotica]KAK5288301.1 hypothetical protein LTR14_008159 [Exophiala xenobiotica]KAK5476577.1 hypothetical protein LTR55_008630 [Exophiala xenobiotica]